MIHAYIIINNELHIVVDADKENTLMWADEQIPCYEVENISYEMKPNNMGFVGTSFFTSDYSMFEEANQEQIDKVNRFLTSLNYKL